MIRSSAAQTARTPDSPPPASPRSLGWSARLLAGVVSVAILALVGAGGAQSASAQTTRNAFGTMKVSKVTGHAAHGVTFAGHYNVKRFVVRNGKVRAVGRLTGTLTRKSGATRHVSQTVLMRLNKPATRAANGPVPLGVASTTAARTATAAAPPVSCSVLNLVLGPLDLNLLGLVVHLDRVVLNITAVPGAGALLGNLLCAVVGLLDGGVLGGLNGILANLLNSILGILQA